MLWYSVNDISQCVITGIQQQALEHAADRQLVDWYLAQELLPSDRIHNDVDYFILHLPFLFVSFSALLLFFIQLFFIAFSKCVNCTAVGFSTFRTV